MDKVKGNQMLGGWSRYTTKMSQHDMHVLEEATHMINSEDQVEYEPIAVATQIVSGKNYSFFCNRIIPAHGSHDTEMHEAFYIDAYESLDGQVKVTKAGHAELY